MFSRSPFCCILYWCAILARLIAKCYSILLLGTISVAIPIKFPKLDDATPAPPMHTKELFLVGMRPLSFPTRMVSAEDKPSMP